VDENLLEKIRFYRDNGGDMDKLTISSDSSITSPMTFFQQIRQCGLSGEFPLEQALKLVTANTASILNLGTKGVLNEGNSADILILEKKDFQLRDVISNGKRLFKDGKLDFKEEFLKESNRDI